MKLAGQEPSQGHKLFIPCRIEKMASQAGAPYRSMHKQGERVTSFALSSHPIFSILKSLFLLSWKPAFTMPLLPLTLFLPENPLPENPLTEKHLPELLPAFPQLQPLPPEVLRPAAVLPEKLLLEAPPPLSLPSEVLPPAAVQPADLLSENLP